MAEKQTPEAEDGWPMEEWVDEVAGAEVDWRGAVRAYPVPTLILAAAAGFVLGQRYGWQLVDDVSAYAAGGVANQFRESLEGELPDERQ